ncbi:hypothetical protein CANARDRAFT_8094 [[Candida] arabinofermentans NRRL YB-2248]|uniref:Uncharacterized protein n=1 Tax=[Candida] arabinofermentans NRRL YB-2248 TaxID=983967 RepID=A0A1E4SZT0_9ASCO|nr:hypothetical protein CANARDRAFT_8094 [[Candida] arabinofermentans NRRL YB-2248]
MLRSQPSTLSSDQKRKTGGNQLRTKKKHQQQQQQHNGQSLPSVTTQASSSSSNQMNKRETLRVSAPSLSSSTTKLVKINNAKWNKTHASGTSNSSSTKKRQSKVEQDIEPPMQEIHANDLISLCAPFTIPENHYINDQKYSKDVSLELLYQETPNIVKYKSSDDIAKGKLMDSLTESLKLLNLIASNSVDTQVSETLIPSTHQHRPSVSDSIISCSTISSLDDDFDVDDSTINGDPQFEAERQKLFSNTDFEDKAETTRLGTDTVLLSTTSSY